jgi:DNA-binding response OmpR family regulator
MLTINDRVARHPEMRILLIEDDSLIGSGLQQGLRKEGFAVDWAPNGASASLALRTESYGLVLLDLGLPDIDGLSLLAKLRSSGGAPATIIITARDSVPERVAGLDSGAEDYLVKPFALDELLARIRVVSRRARGCVPTVLTAGPLRLDPAQHRVWIRDVPVAVTVREFALLQELMRNPTMVLTREQLEDRLYGWNEEIESNAIQVPCDYPLS